MTHRIWKSFAVGIVAFASTGVITAEPPAGGEKRPEAAWARKATKDLPVNRQGGKVEPRDNTTSEAALFFIAPKTTGFTTRELPDVYWYISQPAAKVQFRLVNDGTKKTEVRLELADVQPGFHKIELAREAKAQGFGGLAANDFDPAAGGEAAKLPAQYRMALSSAQPKLLAVAWIARVKGPASDDYAVQIRNELWYDAVGSLAASVNGAPKKVEAPRDTFKQMLSAEEVLRSSVGETAADADKAKARAVEDDVLKKLSVPDPIDLQSAKDHWKPSTKSVPDPIDLN